MLDLYNSPLHAAGLLAGLTGVTPSLRPRGPVTMERRKAMTAPQLRLAQLLDTLDHGVLLTDPDGLVAYLNKAAQRDLDASHPLQIDGLQLGTRAPRDLPLLREALANAAQRGLRRLVQLGHGMHRTSVAVVPLQPVGHDSVYGVALLLSRRQMCEELTVDWFARAHGLTLAETVVIKGLCADLTPQQIAQRQGVGLSTVRTQIGSIRLKTGAGSIRALLRQIALLPPLVSALQGGNPAAPAEHRGAERLNA
jgi:DNA-binding CsgD family transcriptional regulator